MAGRGGLALAVFGTAPYEGRYSVAGGASWRSPLFPPARMRGLLMAGGVASPSPSLCCSPQRDDFCGWESSLSVSFFSPLPPQRGDFRGLYARTGGVASCDEIRNGAFSIDSGRIPRERGRSRYRRQERRNGSAHPTRARALCALRTWVVHAAGRGWCTEDTADRSY